PGGRLRDLPARRWLSPGRHRFAAHRPGLRRLCPRPLGRQPGRSARHGDEPAGIWPPVARTTRRQPHRAGDPPVAREDLGVTHTTAGSWLEALADAYLALLLFQETRGVPDTRKQRKVYPIDPFLAQL